MRRIPSVDLQQQLIQAVHPLRKNHPKINQNLPIDYLNSHRILQDGIEINYLKGLWIVWMLFLLDPSIAKDQKSAELRNFALFCADRIQIL